MGLSGTTSWTRNGRTNSTTNVQSYNRAKNPGVPDINGSYLFLERYFYSRDYVFEYLWDYCLFTIRTDGSGCSSLSFTCGNNSRRQDAHLYWKVMSSSSLDTSGMTECSFSGGTYSGTLSVRLLPNTTYYVLFYATTSSTDAEVCLRGTMTMTGSGTYGSPGNITANNANFDSAVNMSYASATSGGSYTVKVKVGTSAEVTLQTKSSTSSRSWTPSLATYGPSYPNQASVSCVITVETYFAGTLSGTKTKTITLSFTAAQAGPSTNNAFSIAPYNAGAVAGMSGYIQGYSKIRASFNSANVTRRYGASISKWTVKFGSAAAVDVAAGTATKDSGNISAVTTVTCTVVDSRGFSASETYTATITPYQQPSMTAGAFRCDDEGNAADDGTYISVSCAALYADIAGQNSMTVQTFAKLRSSSTWGSAVTITGGSTEQTGTNDTYTASGFLISGFSDAVWDVKIVATDALGNTATIEIIIESQAWALHIRNGGAGAAFGKAAERDSELDIGDWKLTCGAISSHIIVEIASFSSLPKTIYHSSITADHIVIRDEVGTPSVMTSDWNVDTYDGSLTISGSISGSTTLRLILEIPGTTVSG